MNRLLKPIIHIIPFILGLSGFLFLAFFWLPYPTVKSIGDFFSKHGNLRSFTPDLYFHIRVPVLVLSVLLLLSSLWVWRYSRLFEQKVGQVLCFIANTWSQLKHDVRLFFQYVWAARPNKFEGALLLFFTIFGVILRWALIQHPIEYDEAYTFIEFADRKS